MLKQKLLIPEHIAIIPDGNRRWARRQGKDSFEGHREGISFDRITCLFEKAKEVGVKYFTLWLFSTENWNRSKREVNYLFDLFLELSDKFRKYATENKIKFRHIGRKDRLPEEVVDSLMKMESDTKDFSGFEVQFAMDYGGTDEIMRAVNEALKSGKKNITEKDFEDLLDTHGVPNPDLIIRTAGDKRMSGFLSFQGGYAELYFPKVCFPDFGPDQLMEAIEEFSRRKRTYGGDSS